MSANALSISMPTSLTAPRGRVLCVDDEASILRALSWLLEKEFHVVTALSARAALELIPNGDFDVVISDQRMPEMSGVDFLNQVRILAPRAMRILLSGYSDMPAVMRSVNESEIFRYISKPWNVSELPAIVAQAADIARQQPAEPGSELAIETGPSARASKILVLDDDEATHSAVEMSAGDLGTVIHATNPVDAFRILASEDVGVILAERTLGSMDLTNLLCLLKRQHPEIVSIVLSTTMDSNLLTKMINQGQIFRFLTKPVSAGFLRQTLKSALLRRNELIDAPKLSQRYRVETATPEENLALQRQAEAAVAARIANKGYGASRHSMLGQVGGFMRRIFGS